MASLKTYKVEQVIAPGGVAASEVRLVRAATQAQAVRFVTQDSIKVSLCTVEDAVALAKTGVDIEDGTKAPEDGDGHPVAN